MQNYLGMNRATDAKNMSIGKKIVLIIHHGQKSIRFHLVSNKLLFLVLFATLKSETFGWKVSKKQLRTNNFRALFQEFPTKNFRTDIIPKYKNETKIYVKNKL